MIDIFRVTGIRQLGAREEGEIGRMYAGTCGGCIRHKEKKEAEK